MKLRKTQLAAAVGTALLLGAGAVQAQNLQVQLYGQVNRALMFADNETSSKWFHVDGQPSSTRIGIQGTSQIMPGLRAGARIETEMKSNPSNEVSFADPSRGAGGGAVAFAERWLDLFFEGSWGRFEMGQGSGAADDASTIDLSGTGLANGAAISDWGGGIPFTDSTGAVISTPGASIDNLDFESRYDRVRYITPSFGGFKAQVGVGQKSDAGEAREASLWWTGKLAGELQAAIGWSEEKTGTATTPHNETIGGSISWLHTSGFNVTAQYTKADLSVASTGAAGTASDEAKHWMGKVGYKFGQHAISVAYFLGEDQVAIEDEVKAITLGYTWSPIRWAEVYANYIMYSMDHARAGLGDANDIKVFAVGSRIRF